MTGGSYGSQIGALPRLSGGRPHGQYLRRGAESVYLPIRGQPVHQAARRAAAGTAVFQKHARRCADERGEDAAGRAS